MKLALLFPGQGSQVEGMGRDVAEASTEAMDLWKRAERLTGLDLRSIYWESGDAALMADTRALQPALAITSITLWMAAKPLMERKGLTPCCAAGHSLGEYPALVAAGALSIEDAIELTARRGALMADADPDHRGGMAAAVKLAREDVEAAVTEAKSMMDDPHEILLIANYNMPLQFVLSGTRAALEVVTPLIKARKGRLIPLAVSGAFHSPLMSGASRELAEKLAKTEWHTPRFPVFCNATGRPASDRHEVQDLVTRQMISSVFWIDTIRNQWESGVRAWLELGPKPVLSRMTKPILDDAGVPAEELNTAFINSAGTLEALYGLFC